MRFVVLAILLAAPSIASAQSIRAAADAEAIAFHHRDDGEAHVLWARDGAVFEEVPLPEGCWVLDLHVSRDTLVIATLAAPHGVEITITRIGPAGRATEVLPALSDMTGLEARTRFVPGPAGLSLVTSEGVYLADRVGRGFRLVARLSERVIDPYAFYAASSMGSRRGIDILAPVFDTCGSLDALTGLVRVHVDPSGRVTRASVDPGRTFGSALGHGGTIYGIETTFDGETFRLTTLGGRPRRLHTIDEAAGLTVRSSERFTVAIVGRDVLRLRGASAVVLGELDVTERPLDVFPDHRGRALVLFDDGRIDRLARDSERVTLRVGTSGARAGAGD